MILLEKVGVEKTWRSMIGNDGVKKTKIICLVAPEQLTLTIVLKNGKQHGGILIKTLRFWNMLDSLGI